MKSKLAYILLGVFFIVSCAPSMTTAEQAVSGSWILKRTEMYMQDSLTPFNTQNHNNPSNCHLYLTTDPYQSAGDFYSANVGLTCLPQANCWKLSSDTVLQINTGWLLDIKYLTSDSMILQYGYPAYTKYYLSK